MVRTTYMAKAEEVDRKWYVIDATGQTIGRLASEVASILRGKHKPIYTPHVDTGDHVIIINADKVRFTGKKIKKQKILQPQRSPGRIKSSDRRRNGCEISAGTVGTHD